MRNSKKKSDFYSALNVLEVLDENIAGKNGSVTLCAELFLKDYHSFHLVEQFDEDGNRVLVSEMENIITTWSYAMAKQGTGLVWHKQDVFFPCTDNPEIPGVDYMSKAQKRYYSEHTFLKHRCFLFVTKLKKGISPYVSGEELKDFKDHLKSFFNAVEGSCIDGYKIMSGADYIDYLRSITALDFSKKEKKILRDMDFVNGKIGDFFLDTYYINDNTQARKVESYCLNNDRDSGDDFIKSVNSYTFPLTFAVDTLHVINNIILVPAQASVIGDVEAAQKAAAFVRKEEVVAENKEYQNGLNDGLQMGVQHHFSVHVLSSDQQQRDLNRKRFEVAMDSVFGDFGKATYNLSSLWLNTIGGGASCLSKDDVYYTYLAIASAYNNWEGMGDQMRKGIVLQDVQGAPLLLDLFDEPKRTGKINNYNSITVGPTGSGKSVTTNYYATSQFISGDKVVVIDMGRSYQKLCQMLGGRFISYEKAEDLSLNPFCINEKMDKEDWQNMKEFLIDLLFTCWGKKFDERSAEEKAAFEEILTDFYDLHREKGDMGSLSFNILYQFIQENSRKYAEHLEVKKFLYVTRKYTTEGDYGTLLNGDNGLDITHDNFVVFEMERIFQNNAIKNIVIAVLLNFITRMLMSARFKRSGKLLRLHIDEAWRFMEEPEVGDFIRYALKTFRKLGAGANIIVQSIGDFFQGSAKQVALGETIVDSADTIFHLLQKKKDLTNRYGPKIGLTSKEIALINEMHPHEVFIKQGNKAKVYKVVLPDEWLALFNTDAEWQKYWIKILEAEGMQIKPAVDAMAEWIANQRKS